MDVHKRDVKACLIWRDQDDKRHSEIRTYRTVTAELLKLRDWLEDRHCQMVAMESTGVYWKPIFNLLEGAMPVRLVNPAHLKNVPGRKTDVKDCQWIAELLEHGLLKPSFIPPVAIRDLRTLTRYRRKQVETRSDEVNRLQQVLEDANIKLASVATDVMGVSGQAMIDALIAGERDPKVLADLARGRLRNKLDDLELALHGLFRDHHAGMLKRILKHIRFLDQEIAELEAEIDSHCQPFAEAIEQLQTAPGIQKRSAQDLVAETGVEMSQFPSHKHLCSWASICPGNNESGGKRKSGKTAKGNKWLTSILVECGHAAGRTKDTYLGSKYRRLSGRKGKKRAAVAIGHDLLEGVYFMIRDKVDWKELGPDYYDTVKKKHVVRHHVRRLRDLGLDVEALEQQLANAA